MLGRIAKVTAILGAILAALAVSLLIFINPIINSSAFKKLLNSYLKSRGVRIGYSSARADALHGSLTVRGLKLRVKDNIRAGISSIAATNLYHRERLFVSVSDGTVDLKIARKSGKGKKRLAIPPLPRIEIENLRINLNGTPILVESLEARGAERGRFILSCPDTLRIKGSAYRTQSGVKVEIDELRADSLKLGRLLSSLGVRTKLPLLKRRVKVRLEKALFYVGFSPFAVKATLSGPITLKTDKRTFSINRSFLKATTEITYAKRRLSIDITGVHGSFNEIKGIIALFSRARVLEGQIYPMVKNALIKDGSVHLKLHPTRVNLRIRVENGVINIPHTRLTAKDVAADITFKDHNLKILLSQAEVKGLRVEGGKIRADLKKPVEIAITAKIKGKAPDLYPVIKGLPLPEKTLKEIGKHRLLSGSITALLSVRIKGKKIQVTVDSEILAARIREPLIGEEIQAQRIRLHLKQPELVVRLTNLKGKTLKATWAKVEIFPHLMGFSLKGASVDLSKNRSPLLRKWIKRAQIEDLTGVAKITSLRMEIKGKEIHRLRSNLRLKGIGFLMHHRGTKMKLFVPSSRIEVSWPTVRVLNANLSVNKETKIHLEEARLDLQKELLYLSASSRSINSLLNLAQKLSHKSIPMKVSDAARLSIEALINLKSKGITVKKLTIGNGPVSIVISSRIEGENLSASCTIKDKKSMHLKLQKNREGLTLRARGTLDIKGLLSLLKPADEELPLPGSGLVTASCYLKLNPKQPQGFGSIALNNLKFRKSTINGVLHLEGSRAWTENLMVEAPEGSSRISGKAYLNNKTLQFFLSARGKYLNLNEFQPKTGNKETKPPLKLQGRIVFAFDAVDYKDWKIKEAAGNIIIDQPKDLLKARIEKAQICGFSVEATYQKQGEKQSLTAKSKGKNTFSNLFKCLLHKRDIVITGNFTYKVEAESKGKDLVKGLSGDIQLVSKNGRIYKMGLLMKILQTLSIANILTLNLPNFKQKGFPYRELVLRARLSKGKVSISDSYLSSPAVKLVPYGEIDLTKKRMNMIVLAAPFTTVDKILSSIPIIGRILTGKSKTFISFPLKVEGKLKNPSVIPLPPSAISKGVFGIIKRTFETPTKILKPKPQ